MRLVTNVLLPIMLIGAIFNAKTQANESAVNFAYTFKDGDAVALFHHHKAGIKVDLLSPATGKSCVASTGDDYDYENDDYGWKATKLVVNQGCDLSESYPIAVISAGNIKFAALKSTPVELSSEISKLNEQIVQGNEVKKLAEKDVSCGATTFKISVLRVHKIENAQHQIFTFRYSRGVTIDEHMDPIIHGEPLMLVVNGTTFPLAGPCAHSGFSAFSVNDDVYLDGGFHGCECGVNVRQLFKIDDAGPKIVIELNEST